MGIVIHATRLMQPGEFALWGNGKLIVSGLLGSRLEPVAFDAIALHVDDGAVLWQRLGNGVHPADAVLTAIAGWWERGE
jgi:hypothetical protein